MYNEAMRFEVPQFIEIEDKIFGPFTWKQFVYLSGGVGIAVVLFITMPFYVFLFLGVPLGSLAIALAFYPVNNRPFSIFLESMVQYFGKSRLYLWKRTHDIIYRDKEEVPRTERGRSGAKRDITSLARDLELQAMQKQTE